jgi:beta-galactosidase
MKDRFNALLPECQPGPLAKLAGVEVEDYYALLEPAPIKGNLFEGSAKQWAERLKPLDPSLTIPIARYGASNGWLDDQVGVSVHPYGQGMVFYVGAYLDEAAQKSLMDHILNTAGIQSIKTPPGVEVRTRIKPGGEEVYLVMNHSQEEKTLSLPWPAHEHISGSLVKEKLKLPGYGVMVLTKGTSDAEA